MCSVTDEQRLSSLPVMPTGNALSYLSNEMNHFTTYAETVAQLKLWYFSDEQKSRILTEWKVTKLYRYMSDDSKSSRVSVFRAFVTRLMSFQKHLYQSYRTDFFLLDLLHIATQTSAIQTTLQHGMPRTSQQAVNPIVDHLWDRPRTAGSSMACCARHEEKE